MWTGCRDQKGGGWSSPVWWAGRLEHHVIVAESRGHRLTLAQARGEQAALKPCPRNSERGTLYRARPALSRTIPREKITLWSQRVKITLTPPMGVVPPSSDSKFHSEISQGTEIIEISMKFHWPKLLNFMKFCEISMPRYNTSSHVITLVLPPKILARTASQNSVPTARTASLNCSS